MTGFDKIWSIYRGKGLASSQTFSPINTPNFLKSSHTSYLPAYEDGTECSETLAYKIQTPGNYPVDSMKCSSLNDIPGFLLQKVRNMGGRCSVTDRGHCETAGM